MLPPSTRQDAIPAPPSKTRLAAATGAAIVVATILLFAAVLPAEYGFDPLGTGKALGLTALFEADAGDEAPPPATAQAGALPRVYKTESTQFTLGPTRPSSTSTASSRAAGWSSRGARPPR
jgi:hypothetical protein